LEDLCISLIPDLDIIFSIQQHSQFLDKPITAHYNATIRILKYIKEDPSLGLFLSSSSSAHLKAFCDSDWGTCSDSRQSVTDFSVYLGIFLYPRNQRSKELYQREFL